MKTRQRLKRIKDSKSWMERRQLARDEVPGTRFDWLIPNLIGSLGYLERNPGGKKKYYNDGSVDIAGLAADSIKAFGHDLTRAIKSGNSNLFRQWADAVDAWHAHRPQPDKFELAIQLFCVPPDKGFSIREIIMHLQSQKLVPLRLDRDTYQSLAINIRRVCERNKIKIKGSSGRPKK
jgi:hypothetical protein